MSPVVPPIPVKADVHAELILVLTVAAGPELVAPPARLLQAQAALEVLLAEPMKYGWHVITAKTSFIEPAIILKKNAYQKYMAVALIMESAPAQLVSMTFATNA